MEAEVEWHRVTEAVNAVRSDPQVFGEFTEKSGLISSEWPRSASHKQG